MVPMPILSLGVFCYPYGMLKTPAKALETPPSVAAKAGKRGFFWGKVQLFGRILTKGYTL